MPATDYRLILTRLCRCGHRYGDHGGAPPHRCLAFERQRSLWRPVPGWPNDCPCQAFEEAR